MNTTGSITMSIRELDRLRMIHAVAERQLKPDCAVKAARRAVALIRERYVDFGPTLACEKLRECQYLP
ncbi:MULTISPECIES: hypothetical protein [unclassified Caballeronia]|uniref:hypothetical protein n=1 Tax=unclassified Caballeronia TaxID=2646786 RepID=UPI003857E851